MYIDSHAHFAHKSFQNSFRYLRFGSDGFALSEGDLDSVVREMDNAEIACWVEPGISFASNDNILALAQRYPGRVYCAVGVHPTRTFHERLGKRRLLSPLTQKDGVVAIGETGLDYHYSRREQHRLCQILWFISQLELAKRTGLPVILHVRDAHAHALSILKRYRGKINGGVIHCFYAGWEIARQYIELGYHIGIGGSILQKEERAGQLWEAVAQIPLGRMLLETDSPYILPDCKDVIKPKLLRRARNTSLILPAVARKVAQIKNIPVAEVERVTAQNAIDLFSLPIKQ